MKILCVYTTRTGLTEQIAKIIASSLECEMLFVSDGNKRQGAWGYFTAAIAGLKKSLPKLLAYETKYPLEEYDKVILLAPVWCENICPVMRAFAKENKGKFQGKVYVGATHMSNLSYEKPIRKLQSTVNAVGEIYLTVQTNNHDFKKDAYEFAEKIKEN